MALVHLVPRPSRKSSVLSPSLSGESTHSIARLVAKEVEIAHIGQPWHLTVIEKLVDRMLQRLRKRQAKHEAAVALSRRR